MVVVSLFTRKIPREELGGLTWPTINERPISHGAIGEEEDTEKVENGTMLHTEGIELLEKNGKGVHLIKALLPFPSLHNSQSFVKRVFFMQLPFGVLMSQ